jgi:hypothetical protein
MYGLLIRKEEPYMHSTAERILSRGLAKELSHEELSIVNGGESAAQKATMGPTAYFTLNGGISDSTYDSNFD